MTATLNPAPCPAPLLAAYTDGRLSVASMLLIAAHLDLCPASRQHLQTFEAKAGINLEDMPPGALDVTCLENLLQKIDEHGPPACIDVTIPVQNAPASYLPESLLAYTGPRLENNRWQSMSDGVWLYRPLTPLPGTLKLLKYTAGVAIDVRGQSLLLILEGEIKTLMHAHTAGDVVYNNWIPSLGRKAHTDLIGLMS